MNVEREATELRYVYSLSPSHRSVFFQCNRREGKNQRDTQRESEREDEINQEEREWAIEVAIETRAAALRDENEFTLSLPNLRSSSDHQWA